MPSFWHGLAALLAFAAMASYRIWFPRQPYVNRTARFLWWTGHLGALAGVLILLHAIIRSPR
ncbi:MAG TPA: hypothetical protein VK150_05775 [Geothrix sp.]|nr:hypothetical protein [Geothrix sp.]